MIKTHFSVELSLSCRLSSSRVLRADRSVQESRNSYCRPRVSAPAARHPAACPAVAAHAVPRTVVAAAAAGSHTAAVDRTDGVAAVQSYSVLRTTGCYCRHHR